MRKTGSEIIVHLLESFGIKTVAGIPGGSILPLYDELERSSIRHILVRHEQGSLADELDPVEAVQNRPTTADRHAARRIKDRNVGLYRSVRPHRLVRSRLALIREAGFARFLKGLRRKGRLDASSRLRPLPPGPVGGVHTLVHFLQQFTRPPCEDGIVHHAGEPDRQKRRHRQKNPLYGLDRHQGTGTSARILSMTLSEVMFCIRNGIPSSSQASAALSPSARRRRRHSTSRRLRTRKHLRSPCQISPNSTRRCRRRWRTRRRRRTTPLSSSTWR